MNSNLVLVFLVIASLKIALSNPTAAASITSSTNGAVCPGETVTLTCIAQGNSQRWRIQASSGHTVSEYTFTRLQSPGTQHHSLGLYIFTLISTSYEHFESSLTIIAQQMLHGFKIECTGITSRAVFTFKIAGIPRPPQNFNYSVEEYHHNSSNVKINWDRQAEYQIQYYLTAESHSEPVIIYNTSITLLDIPYNTNVSILLAASNCIGTSSPAEYSIYVVGCRELTNLTLQLINSTQSQAPGTQLSFSCYSELFDIITTTCQNNGKWEPDPLHDGLCDMLGTSATIGVGNRPTTSVLLYSLCTLFGVILIGIAFLIFLNACRLRYKRSSRNPTIDVNVVDPIYEVIDSGCDTYSHGIAMATNDAYKEASFCNGREQLEEGIKKEVLESHIQIYPHNEFINTGIHTFHQAIQ